MQVQQFKTKRVEVWFDSGSNIGRNRIDILTGPNGSGKTEILAKLASGAGGGVRPGERVVFAPPSNFKSWHESRPVKVIAQTFSPFSRFPAPRRVSGSMSARYLDEVADELYAPQGFHRGSRSTRPAKLTLEQALFDLSESLEVAPTLFKLLGDLNFQEHFQLKYREVPRLSLGLKSNRGSNLNELLDDAEQAIQLSRFSSLLKVEISRVGRSKLQELLEQAIELVQAHAQVNERFVIVNFGLHIKRSSFDFATLQSMSLLRRLGLMSLVECNLYRRDGEPVNIADASSGQQQLLCSIFGLATALKNHSLVLIDEPELSLHPQWQLAYMDHVSSVLDRFDGCHVLIATHSPLIVQQAQALGAAIVQLEDGQSRSRHLDVQQSVESTLIDVFETAVPGSQHLANELLSAVSRGESGNRDERIAAMQEVARLKMVYERSEVADNASLSLIKQAMDLLETKRDVAPNE